MKYIFNIALTLITCSVLFMACGDEDEPLVGGLTLSCSEIALNADGGEEMVTVTSDGEWTAQASEPWITLSPANGHGTTECVVRVDSTLRNTPREAQIRFTAHKQSVKQITVTQLGYGKMIVPKKAKVELEASNNDANKRYFDAEVTTNVPFKIQVKYLSVNEEGDSLKGWITPPAKLNFELESARPKTFKIRFDWMMNPEWVVRKAQIQFIPQLEQGGKTGEEVQVTPIEVTQKASPRITDDRAGDSLAILIIRERLQSDAGIDVNENMYNWENVKLWERTDDLPKDEEGNPIQEAVGRVKAVSFAMVTTTETLPQEVHYLKYVETFSVFGNVNTMLLSIPLGTELCDLKYLKNLQIGGYGLVSLPEEFKKLGSSLEVLDLSANNFTEVPPVLKKENFPHLKSLSINGNRRKEVSNLQQLQGNVDLGFHIRLNQNPQALDQLFLWDTLEELVLSYNYIEGALPDYEHMPPYTAEDLQAYGDTLNYLLDHKVPKILPKMKHLTLNLNFLTGKLPQWMLYHPHFLDWYPETFVFNQLENAIDSNGKPAKFSNTPTNFEYYFNAYPKYRKKYEIEGDNEPENE